MTLKKTIILIHGFRGTHHGLDKIVAELDDYNCIVPDIPGFGDGDRLENLTIETYVEWLHMYIASLDPDGKPILLGHSFGSIISSFYAAEYSETITDLILVNPIGAPALEGPRKVLTKLAIFYYWLGSKLPDKLASRWLASKTVVMIMSQTMAKTRDASLRQWIHDQHMTYFSRFQTADGLLEAFKTSVEHSVRDVAKNISSRTLLIAGEHDDITPVKDQRHLETLFSNAKLVVIPAVGHLTHYETPKEIAAAIHAFKPL